MKLAVIIVNFNTPAETVECLESLKDATKPTELEIKTIVVDNGSSDDSVSVLEEKFPEVRLIALDNNTGFAGGNNVGISEAADFDPDWYMLLNSDTVVPKSFLKDTLNVLTKTKFDVFAPKIYFASGFEFHKDRYKKNELGHVIWYAGGLLDRKNVYGPHRGVDEVDVGQYDLPEKTDFATGACLVFNSKVLKKSGPLDELLFLYLEDLEFCERATRNGFLVGYEPSVYLWHKVSSSTGGIGSNLNDYFITRNRMLFGMRYMSLRTRFALLRESIRLLLFGRKFQKIALMDYFSNNLGKGSYFRRQNE